MSENILKFLEKFGLGLRRQRAILMARPQRRQRDIRGTSPHQAPVRLLHSVTLFWDTKLFPGTKQAISTPLGGTTHRRHKQKKAESTVIVMQTMGLPVKVIQQAYLMFNPDTNRRSAVFD